MGMAGTDFKNIKTPPEFDGDIYNSRALFEQIKAVHESFRITNIYLLKIAEAVGKQKPKPEKDNIIHEFKNEMAKRGHISTYYEKPFQEIAHIKNTHKSRKLAEELGKSLTSAGDAAFCSMLFVHTYKFSNGNGTHRFSIKPAEDGRPIPVDNESIRAGLSAFGIAAYNIQNGAFTLSDNDIRAGEQMVASLAPIILDPTLNHLTVLNRKMPLIRKEAKTYAKQVEPLIRTWSEIYDQLAKPVTIPAITIDHSDAYVRRGDGEAMNNPKKSASYNAGHLFNFDDIQTPEFTPDEKYPDRMHITGWHKTTARECREIFRDHTGLTEYSARPTGHRALPAPKPPAQEDIELVSANEWNKRFCLLP